jgi:hypothetical protein
VDGTCPRAAELAARGARGEKEVKKMEDVIDFVVKYLGWLVPTSDGFESESDDEEKGKKRKLKGEKKRFLFLFCASRAWGDEMRICS